ncbi:crotonase/enoyl-CoA hydratase family protein [Streptomyces violaceusniger]|uniref:Enoyl CoA dehydratase/isomerase n=1 Tax=Streptomyces violaceusniger TaxID=68280 RepID=A0A4D4LLN7_STRVO|nr:enoyl CoA dehydratase/isomerase [Streptomyces violaceusniger]
MADSVVVERRDRVLVVSINRPEARNAVNREVTEAIAAAVDELDATDDLSLGIITGAGGTFCAGMDLKGFLAGEDVALPGRGLAGICRRPPVKPLIAAVEGWALAGGCEIALACDLIVAAEDARFGVPEVKRGLVAAAGGLLRLPRRLPRAIAMQLALTGEPLTAVEAHRFGLVNEVTPAGGALSGALALARRITANGPLAVSVTKRILDGATDRTIEEGFAAQEPLVDRILASADAREGSLAFAEKRPPVWTGR